MKKIIAFIIIAALSLGFGISIRGSTPVTDAKLKTAISVTDGKIHSENEGKLVIVSGKLEPELPAIDPALDISIPYIKAYRTVKEFDHKEGTNYIYDWFEIGEDYSEENNGGVNGEYLVSGMVIAKTHIGEIEIDPQLLKGLSANTNWNDISEDNFGEYSFNILKDKNTGEVYLSEGDRCPQYGATYKGQNYKDMVGEICYSYTVVDENAPLEYTILGIQKGNKIVEDTGIDCLPLEKGIHDTKDFRKLVVSSNTKMYVVLIAIGFLFMGLAVYSIVQLRKEE
ncbi:hypothetical protein WKS98_02395 [Lagierella sp. ICN-221743]